MTTLEIPTLHHLIEQRGIWYYFRRVPKRYAALDKRPFVKRSTRVRCSDKATDIRRAVLKADYFNKLTEAYWQALAAGEGEDATARFDAAMLRGDQIDVSVMHPSAVAALPLDEMVERFVSAVRRSDINLNNRVDQDAAIACPVEPPPSKTIMLSSLVELVEKHEKGSVVRSEGQWKTWRDNNNWAVRTMCTAAKIDPETTDLLAVTRNDAVALFDWWTNRIHTDTCGTSGGIKTFSMLRSLYDVACKRLQVKAPNVFAGLTFERRDGKREAFAVDFLRDVILAKSNLDKLSPKLRDVVIVVAGTGARPSEICGLPREHIHAMLNTTPFIDIKEVVTGEKKRSLKTDNSVRQIPLVGETLEAMRRNQDGFAEFFDNYYEKAGKPINAWLKSLQPEPAKGKLYKTLYCVRHTFKDRLRAVPGVTDDLMLQLLGHDVGTTASTPDYGDGNTLERKADVLKQMDFGSFYSLAA